MRIDSKGKQNTGIARPATRKIVGVKKKENKRKKRKKNGWIARPDTRKIVGVKKKKRKEKKTLGLQGQIHGKMEV